MGSHTTAAKEQATELQLDVVSFGFGWGPPPEADLVIDLRQRFRDPHVSAELRAMNGRDYAIIANVLSAPGAIAFIDKIFCAISELVDRRLPTVRFAAGCVGGRHRAPVFADQVVFRALSAGWTTRVVHRDIDRALLPGRRNSPSGNLT